MNCPKCENNKFFIIGWRGKPDYCPEYECGKCGHKFILKEPK